MKKSGRWSVRSVETRECPRLSFLNLKIAAARGGGGAAARGGGGAAARAANRGGGALPAARTAAAAGGGGGRGGGGGLAATSSTSRMETTGAQEVGALETAQAETAVAQVEADEPAQTGTAQAETMGVQEVEADGPAQAEVATSPQPGAEEPDAAAIQPIAQEPGRAPELELPSDYQPQLDAQAQEEETARERESQLARKAHPPLLVAGRGQVDSLDDQTDLANSERSPPGVLSEPQLGSEPVLEPEPYTGPAAEDMEEVDLPVERFQPPSSPHVVHVRADVLRERFTEIPSPFVSPSSAAVPSRDIEGQPPQHETSGTNSVIVSSSSSSSSSSSDDDDDGGWIDHGETGVEGDKQASEDDNPSLLNAIAGDHHELPASNDPSHSAEASAADDERARPDGVSRAGLSSQHHPAGKPSQGDGASPARKSAEQIATPPLSPENQSTPPSTMQILGSIQNQQREMQLLQATLATAASQQAERQHQLIEQQLAWYRQQQEQQQLQLEQVQQVSQRILASESELVLSKMQRLQAAQERLDSIARQPTPAYESTKQPSVAETKLQQPVNQTRDIAPRSPTRPDIIDHAAEEAHRTISRMRRVASAPDAKLPAELGEYDSVAGGQSSSKAKVSFDFASTEGGSEGDTVLTSQLMLDMGKRVDRALAEASTVTTRASQGAPKQFSAAEREEAAADDVSGYYQRVRSLMRAVVRAAEVEGGQVSGDVPPIKSADDASFDAVSMMPPSCWPVSAPAEYASSESGRTADASSTALALEVQRRISSVANGTSTVPMPKPKPKHRPKKQSETAIAKQIQAAPRDSVRLAESTNSGHSNSQSALQTSVASHMSSQVDSSRNRALVSSTGRKRTAKGLVALEKQERKLTARESWLTIKRTQSVSAVLRRSSDEFVAHLANVEADWHAGLGAAMVQGAKPDPRWVSARQADTAAVAAVLSARKTRRSMAPLDTPSTAQATSLLGEYSLATTSGQTVVNLYGQQGRRDKPELHHLKSAMTKFLRQQKPKQLTLYKLGCELLSHSGDHLDWATQVRPVLEELGARYKCRLTVWEQEPAAKRKKRPAIRSNFGAVQQSSIADESDRKHVGISIPTGRQTVRQTPQTYSEQTAGPTKSRREPSASKGAARTVPSKVPGTKIGGERLRDSRSTGMHVLVEGMADQIRTRLASAMPSTLNQSAATDSAELLEQLAIKAIRAEVAKVLQHGSAHEDTNLRTALKRGFGTTPTLHPGNGLDVSSDSVDSEEADTGVVSPPVHGDRFDNVLKGLVMALLSDPSRDLLEPLPYSQHSVQNDPFPLAGETGPCLLSTGAAGAWSLTKASGQIVIDEDAVERKERARLEKAARKKEAQARKLALWRKARKFFLNRLPKTTKNVFIAWADRVQGTKRLERLAQQLQEKRDKKQQHAAFAMMHGQWKERKVWRAKTEKFLDKLMGKSVRGCFVAWHNHAVFKKREAAEALEQKQKEDARRAAQKAAEEAREATAQAERELAEQAQAELNRLKLEMENAEKERAAKLAAENEAKALAEAKAAAEALAAQEAALAKQELEAARVAASNAEAARMSALEEQLSKANAASAAAAAAAAAAAESVKDSAGKDVTVSVNWGDLLDEIGPAARASLRRDAPPEELSPIRFAPSNAHDLRDDSDYSPRRRSYKSQARLLESDSDYSDDEGWAPLPRPHGRNRGAAARVTQWPGESSTAAAARRRREQRYRLRPHSCVLECAISSALCVLTKSDGECNRRPWQNPDPTYYDEWRVQKRDQFYGATPMCSAQQRP